MVFLSYHPHRCCVSACHLFHSAIPPKAGPGHGRPKCPAKERTQAETSITGPAWKFDLRSCRCMSPFSSQLGRICLSVEQRPYYRLINILCSAHSSFCGDASLSPDDSYGTRIYTQEPQHTQRRAPLGLYRFQVVRGVPAGKSRVHTLPMVLATTVSAGLTGACVEKLGYYTPFMFWGALIEAVGAGFLSTTSTNTSFRTFASFQILFGIGAGISLQQSLVAVQFVLPKEDIQKAQHPSC